MTEEEIIHRRKAIKRAAIDAAHAALPEIPSTTVVAAFKASLRRIRDRGFGVVACDHDGVVPVDALSLDLGFSLWPDTGDGAGSTDAAAEKFIAGLREAGYSFVKIEVTP